MLKAAICLASLALLQTGALALGDKIFCYYASWGAGRPGNAKVASNDLDPHLCTHIFYSFLGLESNGSLSILNPAIDIEQGNIQKLSDLKKQNPNLKLIFSVGGAAAAPWVFAGVANSKDKRQVLVDSCLEFLQKYNFDGIDIDWEYPYDKKLFVNLFKVLRKGFEPHGYLLATAVAYNPEDAGYDVPGMNEVLDLINVMSYDFHGANGGKTGQNSPLYGSSSESSWQRSVLNANASIWNWRNKGASPEKLALGAGFYGHTFKQADPNNYLPGAPVSGPGDKGPYTDNVGTLGYDEICEFHKNGVIVWDDEQKVPYLHEGNFWVGYDNERSLREKVKYVKEHQLAGIMIWSIETDDVAGVCGEPWALLKAVNDEMRK